MKHMMIKVLSLVMALTMIMGMFGAVAVSAAGHTHTKGEEVKTVAPTCVAYGYTLYECAGCGEQYADDVLPKTEECQNIEDVDAVDATCTADAIKAGKQCQDCGTYYVDGKKVSLAEMVVPNTKLDHNYDIKLIQPTCEKPGAVIEHCTRCYDETKPWTEQADGAVKDKKDLMEGALTPLNGTHTYVYTITVAPTCTDAGKATYECTGCDEVKIENIYVAPSEALHVWVEAKEAATCKTAGLDGWECTECWIYRSNVDTNGDGAYDMKDQVPATNHAGKLVLNLGRDIIWMTEMGFEKEADGKLAATCTTDGYEWFWCPDCDEYVKIDYKATGHSLPNADDKKLMEAVKTWVSGKDAGTVCNEEIADEKGNKYSFKIKSVADCEKGAVLECTNALCSATRATLSLDNALTAGHTHDWNTEPSNKKTEAGKWEITAPTCTTAGWTTVYCKKCPATKKINLLPATGHDLEYTGKDCTTGIKVTCKNDNCPVASFNDIKNDKHALKVEKIDATCNAYAYDAYVCTVAGCEYQIPVDENKDGKADKVYTEEGFDPDNHSAPVLVEGAYYVPATCVTAGKATYACKNCSATSWVKEIPMLDAEDHNWLKIEQKDATCQNKGRTAGYICLTCPEDDEIMAEYAKKNFKVDTAVITGKNADGETVTTDGTTEYVWVSGGADIAKNSSKHEATETKFHRVGTCTMPELYLYQCKCGATWSKEGEKDAKNHNSYIYNGLNEVIGGTYFEGTIDSNNHPIVPSTVEEGEHWGALLTYVEGKKANCETAGNHNYVKCTGCNKAVVVSGYKIDFDEADGTFKVTDTFDCDLCADYVADQIKANDKSADTKSTSVIKCPGITLELKDKGKDACAIDKTKTTWTIEVAATGHKTENVAGKQEDCKDAGYTAGVKCVNARCNLTPSADGNRYVSGHVLLPKHDGKYNTTYNKENKAPEGVDLSKAPTCTEYGIDANKVYCATCNNRKTDITKKDWYIAPEGHDLVLDGSITKSCDEIGFAAYRCSKKCSDESVWADLDANGLVNVYGTGFTTKLENSEYTWFITNYELATSHEWPEYDLEKETGYEEGWFIDGKILTATEFRREYGLRPNTCLVDQVYYVQCENCDARQAVDDVIPATGHIAVDGEVKTPISTNCTEIEEWYGFECYECGLTIEVEADTTHNLVVVTTKTTCTNPGLRYWACADCDKAFYPVGLKEGNPVTDETPNYEFYKEELADLVIDWVKDDKDDLAKLVYECPAKIAKIDKYVKETATEDGYFQYTCLACGETVTVTIDDKNDVVFTLDAADVTGSKVTANGNQIVVSIAYTAQSYKFRTLNTTFLFNDKYLAFDKAEVKAAFAEELAADTDVSVDGNYVDILTTVGVVNGEAELKGEDVAYVDLYFTVKYPTMIKGTGLLETMFVDEYGKVTVDLEALVYDEDGKLVTDNKTAEAEIGDDIEVVVTGDVVVDYSNLTPSGNIEIYMPELNVNDLVALMDMIYTADAEYVAAADINKDGKIDIDDYAALRTFTASKQTAADYAAMMGVEVVVVDYATMIIDALRVQKLDLNDDGFVNALDYEYLVAYADSDLAWELEDLYYLDFAKDNWGYFFFGEYTVEDITELVLDAYKSMRI